MRLLLVFIIFSLNVHLFGNETVRLATYNLRNYLSMDRHIEGLWRQDYPKPEHEKKIVRDIIKEVSADIIALQELGDIFYLEELRSDLQLDGLDYPYLVHMKGEDDLRHIGILSKIKPFEVRKHTDLNFKYFNDHPGSSCFRRFESKGNTMISELLYSSDSRGELWTYFYEREAIYSTVDGFFISTMLDTLADVGVGRIVDSYSPMQGSDHRAVYVDIDF